MTWSLSLSVSLLFFLLQLQSAAQEVTCSLNFRSFICLSVVLAAISRSRSDLVTKFVRSFVLFGDVQVFLQLEVYYV